MEVVRQYKEHYYIENYEKSDLYCPNCGKKEVWEEQGEGDYYLGPNYYCISCDTGHSLTHTCAKIKSPCDIMIVKQLKGDVKLTPYESKDRKEKKDFAQKMINRAIASMYNNLLNDINDSVASKKVVKCPKVK